jgi:class 3 adenylate cyclase
MAHRWLRVTAATPIDEAFHLRHEPNLLKALAEPGGICLSAAAHEQVRDRLGPLSALCGRWLTTRCMGEDAPQRSLRRIAGFGVEHEIELHSVHDRSPSH